MSETCVTALRKLCGASGIKLHERVLENGDHHVWCYHVYRFDSYHRDFAFACLMLLAKMRRVFPFSFVSPRPEAQQRDGDSGGSDADDGKA